MLNNTETTDSLAEIAQSNNKWSKQSRIKSDPMKVKFPKLNESYIRSLTFGVYQLKKDRSYKNEHLDENGNYIFESFEEEGLLNIRPSKLFDELFIDAGEKKDIETSNFSETEDENKKIKFK